MALAPSCVILVEGTTDRFLLAAGGTLDNIPTLLSLAAIHAAPVRIAIPLA
jgi:hypothetical protein